jgi:hypothetical protein
VRSVLLDERIGDAVPEAEAAAFLVEPQQVVAELVCFRRPELPDSSCGLRDCSRVISLIPLPAAGSARTPFPVIRPIS